MKMKNNSNNQSDEEIKPLLELGLNKYEASIYLTLINDGTSTAKDISNITGIPYGKIYEIIDSLSTKGFVNILPSKPMKCQAVSPKTAVENAKEKLNKRFDELESYMNDKLEPKFESHKRYADPKGVFLLINGRANIYKKVTDLLKGSKKTVNIATTENGLKRLVAQREILQDAHARGVDIKIAAPVTKENSDDAKLLSFCKISDSNNVHNTMYTFDNQESMVIDTIPDDENYISGRDLGVHSKSDSFSRLMDDFYHTYHSAGKNVTH